MKKLTSFVLCVVFVCVMLCSCAYNLEGANKATDEMFALDTIISFTVYDKTQEQAKSAIDKAKQEITRCENLLSVSKESSDIYKINESGKNGVKVSDETASIIRYANEVSSKTDGAFDISVYPIMKLWGFDTKDYKVPDSADIKTALEYVDYKNIDISDDNVVTLKDGMSLDLGGIAKGYISSRLYALMQDLNVTAAVINVGGNVVLYGKNPTGELWEVGVQSPQNSDCFASIFTENTTISTTGAYQRNFTVGSETYHHIIDTKTGTPCDSDISSVSVVGMDKYNTDAWSTAYYVMGIDKVIEYYKSNEDAPEFLILDDKLSTVYYTAGVGEVVLSDAYSDIYDMVIIKR